MHLEMPVIDPTNTQKIVGQRLQMLRKNTGKSINEAASEAGLTPGALSKIEDGKSNFRVLTLGKLCRYYQVTLKDLMDTPLSGPGEIAL